MNPASFPYLLIGMLLAPLMLGVINRTKALWAGRKGQPLLQAYFDLGKLLQKGAVYSRTTTWIFRAGPVAGLAAVLTAMLLMPFAGAPAVLAFRGDIIVFAGLLGLLRFFTVAAALDTGSSFAGMGASREAHFAALAEPVLLLSLAVVGRKSLSFSLSDTVGALSIFDWLPLGSVQGFAALALAAAALLIVSLAENARIPVDDPNTHLELTMIHEVMVLDHSGPDLAFILYGAALKLWLFGALLVGILLPVHSAHWLVNLGLALLGMLGLAVVIGIIESTMARLRLLYVPQLLVGAGVLAAVALVVLR